MSSLYQATTLEQAYSLFLAQQVFGIPPGHGPIQIPGRDAVPFLTQSNVDRGILRSLWSVADPENKGTLTQISQLQVLLRLVSMAQAGMLQPPMTCDTVRAMVPQSAAQQLALPTFSSVLIPQQDQLMNAYGKFIVRNNSQYNAPQTPSSNQGGFWSLSQYSSPPLVGNYSTSGPAPSTTLPAAFGQRTVSQGSFGGGIQQSTSFGQQSQVPTVSDAFSDLGPSTDAPLPKLVSESAAENNIGMTPNPGSLGNTPGTASGDGVNNNLEVPINAGASLQMNKNLEIAASVATPVSGDFGINPLQGAGLQKFGSSVADSSAASTIPLSTALNALGEAQDAPLPSFDRSMQMKPSLQQESQAFGGFENALLAVSNNAATMPTPDASNGHSATHDVALRDQNSQMNPSHPVAGGFGGFETVTTINNVGNAAVADKSDPFGPLAGSQDAPLPSLDGYLQQPGGDDDDFGGFEAAPDASTNFAPVMPQDPTTLASIADSSAASTIPMSTAFNALGEIQDAPLPSLDRSMQMAPAEEQGKDDYGGFENVVLAASNNAATMPSPDASNGQSMIQDAALPPLDQNFQTNPPQQGADGYGGFESATNFGDVAVADKSDPFGPLAGSQNAPLPSLDGYLQQQGGDDDDFGGFEAAPDASTSFAPVMPQDSTTLASIADSSAASTIPMSTAFNALGEIQDAPLPSLDRSMQMAPAEEQGEDHYGGFENAVLAASNNAAEMPAPNVSIAQNAGKNVLLTSLDQGQTNPAQQLVDGFGQFNAATNIGNAAVAEESDPFGPLAGRQDAQFSPLDHTMQLKAPKQEESAKFGGFETGNSAPTPVESDPFGPLTGIQDAPLPSLDTTSQMAPQQQESDLFSGFADPSAASDAPNAEEPDAFGSQQVDQDSPLPQQDHTGQNVPEPMENEKFGGFETAAPRKIGASSALVPEIDLFGPLASGHDFQSPSLDQSLPSGTQEDNEGDFGVFETAASADQNKTYGYGSYSAAAPSKIRGSGPAPEAPSSIVADADPFGTMGFQDAPLPPLDQFSPNVASDADELTRSPDSDFGGFTEVAIPDREVASETGGASDFEPHQEEEDEFGEFGGFEAAPVRNSQAADISGVETGEKEDNDDFGDFNGVVANEGLDPSNATEIADGSQNQGLENEYGSLGVQPSAGIDAEAHAFGDFSAPTHPQQSQDSNGDEWGAFDSGVAVEAPANAMENSNGNNDTFGDFSAPANPSSVEDPKDSEWGVFDSSVSAEPPATPEVQNANNDEWGAFDSGIAVQLPSQMGSGSTEDMGLFGDFSTPSNPPAKIDLAGDDWGKVYPGTPSTKNYIPPQTQESDDDGWGAFDNAGPAKSGGDKVEDFSNFQSTQEENFESCQKAANNSSDDEFGDFGGFAGAGSGEAAMENAMQEKVRALSFQLPDTLLRKSGLSGDHVDLGVCFEVHLGLELELDASKKQRFERCIQVLEIVTKSDSKLASYWEQLFIVVKDELVHGKRILSEAKKLSPDALKPLKKPLKTMILGLAEYIRVVRSIVGTIGDMLMLDDSALLTIDTLGSTWCSLSILEKPLEIEKVWKELEKETGSMSNVAVKANDANMSLKTIRRRIVDRFPSGKLCELTLVPLSKADKGTTTSVVSWQGKHFMACSANILANRCPFYVSVE